MFGCAISALLNPASRRGGSGISGVAPQNKPYPIGILRGEGIGPELIDVCSTVLDAVSSSFGIEFDLRFGGPIGRDSEKISGESLTTEVVDFCENIFRDGGAILAGPGGGRFVYEMRRKFDLFAKLNPLISFPELADVSPINPNSRTLADILVVRDNRGGLYQGNSTSENSGPEKRILHTFSHSESEVLQLLSLAARLASERRGHLTVIVKASGLPELSHLWEEAARNAAAEFHVELRKMDIDFAAYQLIARPSEFDVIAVPNCFGDILSDLGGLLMGSRGVTFGASYTSAGHGVYQTNHGAAYDLAGKDTANPAGQLFSLAMLLAESFGLHDAAAAIIQSLRQAWKDGWRTADLMASGNTLVGTAAMGGIVAANIAKLATKGEPHEISAPAR